MKKLIGIFLLVCTGCSTLPQLYQAAEDIADDDAINVTVSREAIQKDTNLQISVDLTNSYQEAK
jgi:hypothetical protein